MPSLDHELWQLGQKSIHQHTAAVHREISSVSEKVNSVRERNRILNEELWLDSKKRQLDPLHNKGVASKLGKMSDEGTAYAKKLEMAQKKNEKLDLDIMKLKLKLAELDSANKKSENTTVSNHDVVANRIRKMEGELDRKMVVLNSKIFNNTKLRDQVDHQRMERMAMDTFYNTMSWDTYQYEKKIELVQKEVKMEEDKQLKTLQDVDSLRENARREEEAFQENLEKKMKDLKFGASQDIYMDTVNQSSTISARKKSHRIHGDKTIKEESALNGKLQQSRWQVFQSKVTADVASVKFRTQHSTLAKMHRAAGTKTVDELVEAFVNQEREQFNRIEYINQLAEEIETSRAKCGNMRETISSLKQGQFVGVLQKTNRKEELESQMQIMNQQIVTHEAETSNMQSVLGRIKPLVESLHAALGCKQARGGEAGSNTRKYLGQIESRVIQMIASMNIDRDNTESGPNIILLNGQMDGGYNPLLEIPQHQSLKTKQPYRYDTVRPPTLRHGDMNAQAHTEEYPLTYAELKSQVWREEELTSRYHEKKGKLKKVRGNSGWQKKHVF